MNDMNDMEEFNSLVSSNKSPVETRSDAVHAIQEDESNILSSSKSKMWAVHGNSYTGCEESIDYLPAAQYTIKHNHNIGTYFSRHETNLDDLLILPDSASEEIISGIEDFWNKEKHFRNFKFLWKRGILLWGPAGSGKTSTLQLISHKIINRNGLAIYVKNPSLGALGLELLRKIEPKRPIVVMLEDIDAIVYEYGEAELLSMLDGELQIDNVVFIATTNYPEKLDRRLVNRPSRFDVVKKIGMPNSEARAVYLSEKKS